MKKKSLKDISEMISKNYGYKFNDSFNFDNIYINNILSLYEEICFDYFKEKLMPHKLANQNSEINDPVNDLQLITKKDISKATKKFVMRYCLGDYDKKENILKNMKIDNMFLKRDIWKKEIFNSPKFKEDCEKLKSLNIENDNYLDNYFLYNIINENDSESPEKPKETESNEIPDNNEGGEEDKNNHQEDEPKNINVSDDEQKNGSEDGDDRKFDNDGYDDNNYGNENSEDDDSSG